MMETNDLDYFKQKIYEISGVPKFSLEKIVETHNGVLFKQRFWKFIEYLIKTKNNKNI